MIQVRDKAQQTAASVAGQLNGSSLLPLTLMIVPHCSCTMHLWYDVSSYFIKEVSICFQGESVIRALRLKQSKLLKGKYLCVCWVKASNIFLLRLQFLSLCCKSENKTMCFSEQALSASSLLQSPLHTTVTFKCCGLFILFRVQPTSWGATDRMTAAKDISEEPDELQYKYSTSYLKCCVMRCWTGRHLDVVYSYATNVADCPKAISRKEHDVDCNCKCFCPRHSRHLRLH